MQAYKTKSVPALERALTVLELLAASKRGLTPPQVSRHLGLARSSVHYLLLTLERKGYIHRDGGRGRYLFTLKLLSLATAALTGLEVCERSTPHLSALMQRTGLTVHMGILERNEVVLIQKIEPPGVRLPTWVGKRMPVHCTGVGKAFLAYLPEAALEAVINHGLPRYNENTIASAKRLKAELAQVRELGYSLDDEEETIGLRCVGAPVLGREGRPVAAISVAGTTTQIPREELPLIGQAVKATAAAIAQEVAGDAPATPKA